MYTNRIAVSLVLALTAVFCLTLPSWTVRSAPAPRPPAEDAALRGKVIVVVCDTENNVVMEKVKVRQFGARAFLVGKVLEAEQGRESLKGKTVWQNMDHVLQIIECENVDEAKKTMNTLTEGMAPPPPPLPGKEKAPFRAEKSKG
jgi:hypothetical protein